MTVEWLGMPSGARTGRTSDPNRPDRREGTRPRRVVFVVFPDLQVLDLTGPHEVFSVANRVVAFPSERASRGPAPSTSAAVPSASW